MSLILDALKKAEQDRNAGQAPVLDEVLVRRPPVARRRESDAQQVVLMACAIAAVLFALAGVAYWLWPSGEAEAPAVAAASPAAPPPAALASNPATRIDPERLEAPVADVPEPIADAPVSMAETGAADATTLDELDGGGTPDPGPALAAAPPPAAAAPALSAPAAVEPVVEPVVAEPVAAAPPAPTPEPGARPLKEMPPAFRSEFPKLVLDVHVYNDNPLRRFVLVNGKKYRETDTLLDGPRVVEITPAGVIVEHRGSRVLVQLPG